MIKKLTKILMAISIFLIFTSCSFASNETITDVNMENYNSTNILEVYSEMEFESDVYSEEGFDYEITNKSMAYDQIINSSVINLDSANISSSKASAITTGMIMYSNQVYQTEKFSVYVTDSNGTRLVLNNQPITFTVNGVNYVRNTDAYGIASLILNLNAQSTPYTININFNGYGNYAGFNGYAQVHVIQKSIILNPLTVTVHQGDGFKVKLTDGSYIPVANKNVKIILNGVTYERTTDAKGVANLNINLNPTSYSISILFNSQPGYKAHNTITQTLTVKSGNNLGQTFLNPISSVFYNGGQFKVKLTNNAGTGLSGKTVSIYVNGVSYSKVTDSQGIATLNMNLNSANYNVVVNFAGDSSYKSTANYKLIHIANSQTDNNYQSSTDYSLSYYASASDVYSDYSSSYIQSLSSELISSCTDDLEKSIALYQRAFQINYLYYGNHGFTGLNTLLNNMGNCVDQTTSFVALSRASNMPIRYVFGSNSNQNLDAHAWAQVCIDNIWVVADPTNTNLFGNGQAITSYQTRLYTPLSTWVI